MIKRQRICLFCHQVGIMLTFETGNKLRLHVKTRHPRTKAQMQTDKNRLRLYRKNLLLQQEKLRKLGKPFSDGTSIRDEP